MRPVLRLKHVLRRVPVSSTAAMLIVAAAFTALSGLSWAGQPPAAAAPAAPQPAEALAGAKGVEQLGMRTRTSRTYLDDRGMYQTVISPGSVNYRDSSGTWQPIDTTLVPAGDGFGVRAAGYGLSLPARAGSPLKVSVGDSFVALSLVGADAAGSVGGSEAT